MTTCYDTDLNFNIKKVLGMDAENKNTDLVDLRLAIHNGFPFSVFEAVQNEIELTQNQLSGILGISSRTIARRKENKHLTLVESDLLYRVARVVAETITIFGDAEKSRVWLKRPNRGLDGEIPLNLLRTNIGSQQVEDVLQRIKFGIYS